MIVRRFQAASALWKLLRFYPWAIPLIVTLGVLTSFAEGIGITLFIPLLKSLHQSPEPAAPSTHWLVDSLNDLFSSYQGATRFGIISSAVFACILLKAALSFANALYFRWLEAEMGHRIRSGIIQQVLSVSCAYIEQNDSGRILNALHTESWRTNEAFTNLIQGIITTCTTCVYVVILFLISWKLTLVVGAGLLAISIAVSFFTRRVKALGKKVTRTNAILANRMIEQIDGMKVIRAFGQEIREQKRFDRTSWIVSKVLQRMHLLADSVSPISEVLAAGLLISILLTTMHSAQNLPAILVFIFVLYRLQPRIMALESARVKAAALAASVEEITALLDPQHKPYLSSGSLPFAGLKKLIHLQNVSFQYRPGQPSALNNVCLQIPAGLSTALVGPSGAGKSTIIQLLLRFYDPTSGQILIDGVPLRDLDLSNWRSRIAVVSQDVYMFNSTIRGNIAYGSPNASRNDVIHAAHLADAHDFISRLPQGYETHLGDRGVRLSGGQKQRITLARAIVRNPDLLILDEATNALDALSENTIQTALTQLSRDRTVLIVAHKLSTISHADHIVVLNQGQAVEGGTHQSLKRQNGLFTRLYHSQPISNAILP